MSERMGRGERSEPRRKAGGLFDVGVRKLTPIHTGWQWANENAARKS
jgi:hypothetical protein